MPEAASYDYPVQYEVRIRMTVNARTPDEAVHQAQQLLSEYPIFAEVIDPRDRLSLIKMNT